MKNYNRRTFIRNSSLALAGMAIAGTAAAKRDYNPRFAFSTLGCPRWSFNEIVSRALEYGYEGIEIRGIQRKMDITKSPEFNGPESRSASMKLLQDNNLKFVCLGASAGLHHSDAQLRKSNLDEAKGLIDLADEMKCPFVRVFPDRLPKEKDRRETLDLIVAGMEELGLHAKGSKVSVVLESHGDVIWADDLVFIMKNSYGPNTGFLWDVSNMWSTTKEPLNDVYRKLRHYIRHVHFRDVIHENGAEKCVLLGQGEVPVREAAVLLKKDNYKGFISYEWEKYWMPKIEDPEVAFPQFIKEAKTYFWGM